MKRHAYCIMVHEYNEVLETLLLCIDDVRNDIFIHVDAKCQFPYKQVDTIVKDSVVYFVPRVKVMWGGYSQIKAELSLLTCATATQHYAYYHLLSGACLPLKTQDEIHRFFDANKTKEFVHFDSEEFSYPERVKYYWLLQEQLGRYDDTYTYIHTYIHRRLVKINKKIMQLQQKWGIHRHRDVNFQKGANWFSITDDLARYIVSKKRWIRRIFSYTYCCDEVFLQTIIINSEFEKRLYVREKNNDCHAIMCYIDWKRGAPYVFRESDYDELMNSGCLFARKFSDKVDVAIVRKIKEKILDNL